MYKHPIFALGFRIFFSLSALSACLLIALWLVVYSGKITLVNYFPSSYWHAHEMIFAYSVAVIAGFLLTAVKNWTGESTPVEKPLAMLALLWVAGRIMPFTSNYVAQELIALIDLLFLPYLAYVLSQPILKANYTRGWVFIALLALMTLANALIHAEILGWLAQSAWMGLQISIAIVIVMILVIAGRVFPFFTERGAGVQLAKKPLLDALAIGSAILVFTLWVLNITEIILALAAGIAVIFNTLRLKNWAVYKIGSIPLLWVLYSGYIWIIIGFFLTIFTAYSKIPSSLALHAFTMGGIGIVTLAMMARVSLGHTGRPLQASDRTVMAFILINVGAAVRIIAPILIPTWYTQFVLLSGLLWLVAFILFLLVYLPILTTARVDGKTG